MTFLLVNKIKMIGRLPSSPGKLTRTYNKEVRWLTIAIMHLNFSFNLLTQPLKYCAENYLRGIVDCCTRCCQKHFIWYVAQFIFTGPASMKWRRKILTKQRESVLHFSQNIRTVLACGRCTIHMLYAFSTENLF